MNHYENSIDANTLDHAIPLNGASHKDVVSYSVDVPMRYAECFATLADGGIVRLKDARQFLGWSGLNGARRLIFDDGSGSPIEIPADVCGDPACCHVHGSCRYVARDGSLQIKTFN